MLKISRCPGFAGSFLHLSLAKRFPPREASASEDGSECDGWRRELGTDEVCENCMDAKFGGEDADMAESQRS